MRIKAAEQGALNTVSMQALKDANLYCPEDQENLVNSSLTNSEPERGSSALGYGIWRVCSTMVL